MIHLPQAKSGEEHHVPNSRVSTLQEPVSDSDLQTFIGKKLDRSACDGSARREEHDALLLIAQICAFPVFREDLIRYPDLQGLEKPMAKFCLPELGDLDGRN